MTELVDGDDGLPVEKVGRWTLEKHAYLTRYVDISRSARAMYLGPRKAGASFVDLFSSCGRAQIRETGAFIDGSSVVAWKAAAAGKAPFASLYIADLENRRRAACAERLRRLDAPVVELPGEALSAAATFVDQVNPAGLHVAFLDPHSLGALDFRIIERLSRLQRIDMVIHVSVMDLQRNLRSQLADEEASQFDVFAPGWREQIDLAGPGYQVRQRLIAYWSKKVQGLGFQPSDARLIKGGQGQRLYWLMLASRHNLATKFWKAIGRADGQTDMEF